MKTNLPLLYFRVLLRLYPRDFRQAYGSHMEEAFLASLRRRAPGRGSVATCWVCARVTWDSILHAADLRFRRPSRRAAAEGGMPGRHPHRPEPDPVPGSLLFGTLRDVRFTVRGLVRSPTFTVVVILVAGLGISVATLVFTIVNATFLRPLPHVRAPEELVRISREVPSHPDQRFRLSYQDFRVLRERSKTLTHVVGVRPYVELMLRTGSELDRQVVGGEVTANYFQDLGIPMALGRGILPEDGGSGTDVAVLGHTTWMREFGGDPGVLGRTIRVDGRRYSVVGVAPPGLGWLTAEPLESAVWIPLRARYKEDPDADVLEVAGRRRDQAALAQVQADLDALVRGLAASEPNRWTEESGSVGMRARTDREARLDLVGGPRGRASLVLYMVLVGLVMTITCSNVASLLLNRGVRRRREIVIRMALGAGRGRLVAQLVAESVLLFSVAGALALFVLGWATRLLAAGWGAFLPAVADVTLDLRVVAFALGVTVVCGVAFGLVPALQATRTALAPVLRGKAGGRRLGRFGARSLFVTAQVAGSMVLVAVSALLVRDVRSAGAVDIGFDPRGIDVASLDLGQADFSDEEGRVFLSALRERLEALPGVEAVAMSTWIPLSGSRWTDWIRPEDFDVAGGDAPSAVFNAVTPRYFRMVGMPLISGRDFEDSDDGGAPQVVIVNQAFVRRHWPGQDPLGRTVILGSGEGRRAEVVGVVRDAVYGISDYRDGEAAPHFWVPRAQVDHGPVQVLVRGAGATGPLLAEIREEIRLLNEDLPVLRLSSMEGITDDALLEERLGAALLGGFSLTALLLAALGVYGIMAHAVMERTQEMGVRLAVGARPPQLVTMVLADSLKVSALGGGFGLALAVPVAVGIKAILVEARAVDPVSLAASVVVLGLVAIMAGLVPAVRAARLDPVISLRSE